MAGALFGFLILLLPIFALLVPAFAVISTGGPKPKRWLHGLMFVLIAVTVVSIWSVRNYLAFHEIIPISTNGGGNLLLGNSENSRPNSGVNVDTLRFTEATVGMSEAERDRFYFSKAISWISTHPYEALRLYFLKVVNYFNYRNELATPGEHSKMRDAIMFVSYYPLLLLLAVVILVGRRLSIDRDIWILAGLYCLGALVTAVYFTRLRFRVPFDYLLVGVAAVALDRLRKKPWSKNSRPVEHPEEA